MGPGLTVVGARVIVCDCGNGKGPAIHRAHWSIPFPNQLDIQKPLDHHTLVLGRHMSNSRSPCAPMGPGSGLPPGAGVASLGRRKEKLRVIGPEGIWTPGIISGKKCCPGTLKTPTADSVDSKMSIPGTSPKSDGNTHTHTHNKDSPTPLKSGSQILSPENTHIHTLASNFRCLWAILRTNCRAQVKTLTPRLQISKTLL